MILAVTLGAIASFFGGAYVGTVVSNATEAPDVAIQSANVQTENKPLSTRDYLLYGAAGIGAYMIYRKYFRR